MKSLADIYYLTGSTRFRVRNVETLQDVFILDITAFTQGRPTFLSGLHLEERTFVRYQYGGNDRRFALLSTKEECDYWKGLDPQQAAFKAKFFYREAANKVNKAADADEFNDTPDNRSNLQGTVGGHMFSG